ncbi:ABC transporter permease [Acrocarpospora macrocephala]|nr:ABC transporter permease [Acrocarpospora macrocephala]
MTTLIRRRMFSMARFVLLLVMVSVATFLLLELIPGDPVDGLLPEGATEEMRQQLIQLYGFDQSLVTRYVSWLGDLLHGDLGTSWQTRIPVATTIAERAPVSLELAVLAMALALAVAIPVGIYSAYRPGGIVDRIATFIASATLATPAFVLAIVLVWVFGVQLGWLPIVGWVPFSEDPFQHLRAVILPVISLAGGECVLFIRLLKGDMMATLQQDHVLSARARGLPTWRILVRHALRQSSFSLVTVSGVVIGRLIGGAVIVEMIFSIPGLGSLVVIAINNRDFITVQAIVLLSALIYLVLNSLVDLAYPLLDPRVRRATT